MIYFFNFQLTISTTTQTTATIKTTAEAPNNIFDNSGIVPLIADAIIEMIKSTMIATFLIKPVLDIYLTTNAPVI